MELRHLKSFLAVAEQQNYRRAAEILCLTQPAVSRHVQILEEELGTRLFERHPQGVRLTPAGQVFLLHARRTLDEAQAAADAVRELIRSSATRLRICVPEYLLGSCIPDLIDAFVARHRDVRISQLELPPYRGLDALRRMRADAVFVLLPIEDDSLEVLPIARVNRHVWLPAHHPLAHAETIRLADLKAETIAFGMQRGHNPGYYDTTIAALVSGGIPQPKIVILAEEEPYSLATTIHVSRRAGAIYFGLPWGPELDGYVRRPLTGAQVPVDIGLAYRKDWQPEALQRFIAVIEERTAESRKA